MIRESDSSQSGANSAFGTSEGTELSFGMHMQEDTRPQYPFTTKTTELLFEATRDECYRMFSSLLTPEEMGKLHEEIAGCIRKARRRAVQVLYQGFAGIEGYVGARKEEIDTAVSVAVPPFIREFLRTYDKDAAA